MVKRTTRSYYDAKEKCEECNGIGIIQVQNIYDWGYDSVRHIDCEKCDGKGRLKIKFAFVKK